MPKLYVEYALSFGIERYEGLWKIQYLHPEDASIKVQTLVPMSANHEMIGKEVGDIKVARPGARLVEVMGWLYDRITRYPYYWPKEGTYVDKFGYDFEVEISDKNETSDIEITQVAYDILKHQLRIQPPPPDSEREIDIQVEEPVPGGGVIVKLSVTLDRAQPISELSIAPFTKYPMELVSVMYEEDIETFHPKKELILPKNGEAKSLNRFEQTTESIRLQFPVVTAKRITFILRQQNHEKNTYIVNKQMVNKSQLWQDISIREAEVTLDTTDGLETLTQEETAKMSGWDIYIKEMAKYKQELVRWQKEFELYKQRQAERERKLGELAAGQEWFAQADSSYRAEYKKAVMKYKTKILQHQKDMQDYTVAYEKYQRDLKVYNKQLRDHAEWKNKWG